MLKDPRKKDKRDANYVGPYSIGRKDQNGNCVLVDNDGVSLARHVPPDQLKFMSLPATSNSLELSDNVRTIKSVVDHKGNPGISFEYLVRWADGTESWEPASGFYDTECIRTYWRTRSKKLKKRKSRSYSIDKDLKPSDDSYSAPDFVGGEVKDSNSDSSNSHSNSVSTQNPLQDQQSQLQTFVDNFIKQVPLTSRKFQLRNEALYYRLQNQLLFSNLKFTFGDVVNRLRKTLRERFPE